ncbi:hypothetical protein NCC49_005269 [Naganishia albida]|nr:hypothetical protein NCC49_005269 [Naganishia albida]
MRWSSWSTFIVCTSIPLLVHAQGELGAPCVADDSTSTGVAGTCDSGYCRSQACSDPTNIVVLGGACSNDNQCVNAETYAEIPASCAGLPGTTSTCGGPSAFCYGDFGSPTGPSSVCASNICKSSLCAATLEAGIPPGGVCNSDSACSGYGRCIDGACNDVGLPCTSGDGTQTGPSTECFTGYCRNGGCASFPGSTLGQACASDANCIGSETYGAVAASCAGTPGTQPTCGGASAFCYTLAGSFTGESPVCASNICKNGQCAAVNGVPAGGACQLGAECAGYANCIDGFCNDRGFPCASDDGTQTGPSSQCSTGYCRNGGCASFPGATLGQACSSDANCISAESYGETAAACSGLPGSQATCGGAGAFCYTADGSFTGPSPVCASNVCKNGQCAALNGVPAGGACSSNAECDGYASCLDGACDDRGFPCQCFNYACTDVSPTPGLRKRVEFPVQQVIQKQLCPKGYEPCPLYPSGYECVDVMNDIESCGGCVGRNMPGVDCSADVHVAAVSCVRGKCVIAACEEGFVVAALNNTCVAA